MELGIVKQRDRLKPHKEPYWQMLAGGQYLGFRVSAAGNGGNWIARYYDPETRKNRFRALGRFDALPGAERFSAASGEARAWFSHLSGGGSHATTTVKIACQRYALSNLDAQARFSRYLYNDPLAAVDLHKLNDRHVRSWRQRLEAMPAIVSRNKVGLRTTRQRAPATINRDMVALRAALNMALAQGDVTSSRAWKDALEPLPTTGRRTLYLDRDERRLLLSHLDEDTRQFVTGLCLLPLRPGALANLNVGDFDTRSGELSINKDKAGVGRRILVPELTAQHLRQQAAGKQSTSPLFTRAGGMRWNKDSWKKPVKIAAAAAGLPTATTAYTLRHSTITDLVHVGLDLLTVAQLSGTSVGIIEKHYGHLKRAHAAQALAGLAL